MEKKSQYTLVFLVVKNGEVVFAHSKQRRAEKGRLSPFEWLLPVLVKTETLERFPPPTDESAEEDSRGLLESPVVAPDASDISWNLSLPLKEDEY